MDDVGPNLCHHAYVEVGTLCSPFCSFPLTSPLEIELRLVGVSVKFLYLLKLLAGPPWLNYLNLDFGCLFDILYIFY